MNELNQASSLYLLQHKDNPVHWKAWSIDVFKEAQILKKPVIVSVGYATCHWCHVMERESFEDESIATYMNEHFLCVKVDREEHPEVDHMLMDALIAMTNQGGWPMNMFLTPDMKPFYGGTYFPPRRIYNRWSWMEVLQSIVHLWDNDREQVGLQADQLLQHLSQVNAITKTTNEPFIFDPRIYVQMLLQQADRENGGWGNAPKFPSVHCLDFILEAGQNLGDELGWDHIKLTLDKMISGGIYDHIEGGWFRYATDANWKVPHFEKMLYDNAQLLYLLAKVYRHIPDPLYLKAIEQSVLYFVKNWMSDDGLFYSALDADSEGIEGKYYRWDWDELEQVIDHPLKDLFYKYYDLSEGGNWESSNVIHAYETTKQFCINSGIDIDTFSEARQSILSQLLEHRSKRILPDVDKKCQLSWNALFNLALTEIFITTENDDYIVKAKNHMQSMISIFEKENEWKHLDYDQPFILANADDFAFLIKALTRLASVSMESHWIKEAIRIMEICMDQFYDESIGMFYYSHKTKGIPIRKRETIDNILPSVNAVMSEQLRVLGVINAYQNWISIADFIDDTIYNEGNRFPQSIPYTLKNLFIRYQFKTVALSGKDKFEASKIIRSNCGPNFFIYANDDDSKMNGSEEYSALENHSLTIITCDRYSCHEQIQNLKEWLERYC